MSQLINIFNLYSVLHALRFKIRSCASKFIKDIRGNIPIFISKEYKHSLKESLRVNSAFPDKFAFLIKTLNA